jgi:Flp pilus assembly secretin CpaC
LSEGFRDKLERFNEEAGKALDEAVRRQSVPEGLSRQAIQTLAPGEPVWIQVGKSKVLRLQQRATRVSIGDPEIAGIVVVGPQTIIVNGKVLPERDEDEGDGTGVQVSSGIFLGRTLTKDPRFLETTLVLWGEDGVDVHPLIVADFDDRQILLEVTVAEVNRTALEEHGIDWRVAQDKLIAAGYMAGGFGSPPGFGVPPLNTQDPLLPLVSGNGGPTYAAIFPDEDVAIFLRALESEGLARILAQPKITAMSGQTAVFQSGGEIPIRIASSFVASVEFKPFGTLVNFTPRVTEEGDIFLTVTPEVSEADFSQTVEGIPTFRTRRASTTAKLRSGETLMIGGLLQTNVSEEIEGVPYLKDIPYLGYAFSTTRYDRDTIELMVVVKPTSVIPIAPGEELMLPVDGGPLTRDDALTKPEAAEVSRPRLWPPYGFRGPDQQEEEVVEPAVEEPAEEEVVEDEAEESAESEEIRTWEEPMEEEEPSAP